MSQLFTSGGQSIGVSASASVLPMNIQFLISFRMDWMDLLAVSSRDSQESSPTPQFKSINSLALSFLSYMTFSHPYMTTGKTTALTRRTFVGKVTSLPFIILSYDRTC